MCYFHPYLGKIPILTNIFQMGWNHQPDLGCITILRKWLDPHGVFLLASGGWFLFPKAFESGMTFSEEEIKAMSLDLCFKPVCINGCAKKTHEPRVKFYMEMSNSQFWGRNNKKLQQLNWGQHLLAWWFHFFLNLNPKTLGDFDPSWRSHISFINESCCCFVLFRRPLFFANIL